MKGREWDWFGENKLLPMTDGGEEDADVATDGGEPVDADGDADE